MSRFWILDCEKIAIRLESGAIQAKPAQAGYSYPPFCGVANATLRHGCPPI